MDSPRDGVGPGVTARRRPAFGIRARLALLVFVAVAPLIGLAVMQLRAERSRAQAAAEERTAEFARLEAARLDEFVQRIEMLLHAVALQVRLEPPDPAFNDRALRALASRTIGTLGTLNVRDTTDQLLGTSAPMATRTRPVLSRGRRYFEAARSTGRFAVGDPGHPVGDSTLWVVSFGLPIPARAGAVTAVAFSSIRLDSMRSVVDPGSLPERSVITLVDSGGRILFRSLESARFVGRDVRGFATIRDALARAEGRTTAPSELDGIERVVAWRRVQRAPWTVVVGIPLAQVMAGQIAASRADVIAGSLALGLALLLAVLAAGRIVRPITALTADAKAIAHGDLSRRTTVAASDEVGVLAEQFNAMSATLEQQTNVLRESEERYRMLFDLCPLPMLLADAATLDFLVVNEAALRLYGYSREELLSLTARDIRPAEDLSGFDAAIQPGSPKAARRRGLHRTKDGRTLGVEVSYARTSAFGRDAWLAVVNDLTDRERTEAALRESQDRLRQMQKIEAVGSLAAGIAHDFNNLLTGILGSVDLALQSLPETHAAHAELQFTREAAQRATDLTRRLLTFSRQQALAPVHADLRDVVGGMQSLLRRTLGEQIRLELTLGREPCPVFADPSQVEQVVVNLLVNARDAMPRGGSATVVVRALLEGELPEGLAAGRWVLLAVSDSGTGMDGATAARVFEPYFTTKPRGKGTGLGLATVYSVVQNAGGQIRLQTAPAKGSTFRVFLPLSDATPLRHKTPERGVPTGGGETVLLVEDDDAVWRVTARLLETLGYRVLAASGPRQALDLARDHIGVIDVVLTDVIMPGMNGREMADQMRKLRPRVHFVYASGYTDDVALLQQLRESTLLFLQKPFTAESLGLTLRAALDTPPEGT